MRIKTDAAPRENIEVNPDRPSSRRREAGASVVVFIIHPSQIRWQWIGNRLDGAAQIRVDYTSSGRESSADAHPSQMYFLPVRMRISNTKLTVTGKNDASRPAFSDHRRSVIVAETRRGSVGIGGSPRGRSEAA
jgi:hypothetical protein